MNRLCGGSRDSGCWARGCTLPLLAREHNNILAFAFRWEQLWTKMAFCHHTAAARSWCLKEKGPLWQFHIRTLHSPLVSSSIHLHTEWKCQRAASLPCSILSLVSSQNLHAFYHLAKHWSGKLCPNVICSIQLPGRHQQVERYLHSQGMIWAEFCRSDFAIHGEFRFILCDVQRFPTRRRTAGFVIGLLIYPATYTYLYLFYLFSVNVYIYIYAFIYVYLFVYLYLSTYLPISTCLSIGGINPHHKILTQCN